MKTIFVLGVAMCLLSACSTFEKVKSYQAGWRQGTIVAINPKYPHAGSDACSLELLKRSDIETATVRYRVGRRTFQQTAQVPDGGVFHPGDVVVINAEDCRIPLAADR